MIRKNLKLAFTMGVNDFKTKYSGSAFGTIWAFIQPVVTIILYWIVFEFGLRAQTSNPNIPYVIWLMAAMIPYLFLSDALNGTMNCFLEYSYLVKKSVFNISVLPLVKIVSALFVHVFFLIIISAICFINGIEFNGYTLQILYYFVALVIYILSLSYFNATVVVFFRDLSQVVNIVIQIGMWATPILWPISNAAPGIKWMFYINPVFYVTEGYREAITCEKIGFWDKPEQTVLFFVFVLINLVISRRAYSKLRGQLAEVL